MNQELAYLFNMSLEERISTTEAGSLMKILQSTAPGLSAILPPSPVTALDLELGNFDSLFSPEGCSMLLSILPERIVAHLEAGEVGKAVTALAMLDVIELAGYWEVEKSPGYVFGSGRLEEREYGYHLKGGAVHFSGNSLAMRMFGHPVPARWPEKPTVLIREEEERRVEYIVHPEPESVAVEGGTFESCLKFTHRLSTYHLPFAFLETQTETLETRTFWVAPGVGPVRAVIQRGGETRFEVELVDAWIAQSNDLFPHETGSWWLFEGSSEGHPHRELWRSLAADENDLHWFTVAAYPYTPDEAAQE